jgi:hypothetical protein
MRDYKNIKVSQKRPFMRRKSGFELSGFYILSKGKTEGYNLLSASVFISVMLKI